MKRKTPTAASAVQAKKSRSTPEIKETRTSSRVRKAGTEKNPTRNGPQIKGGSSASAPKRKSPVTKTAATKSKRAKPQSKTAATKKKPVTKRKATPKKKVVPKKKAAAVKKTTAKKTATKKKKPAPKKKTVKKVAAKKGAAAKGKAKGKTAVKKVADKKVKNKKPAVHPNDKLTPNPAIEIAKKDIMFEEKNCHGFPELSTIGKAKSAIRAVLTNDMPLLKQLISSTKEVPSMFVPRSVDIPETALLTAMKVNNQAAMGLLISQMETKNVQVSRITMATPSLRKENTGRYNYRTLGFAVRSINVARGGREGNDAFIKDLRSYSPGADIGDVVDFAAKNVDKMAVLQTFLKHPLWADSVKDDLSRRIWEFARRGSYKIVGELVHIAQEDSYNGFNKLHGEVLTVSKPEELTPFRSVSVKKKPLENQKITPLHLAAINPNPDIMLSLLAVVPEFYIQDKNGYGLVHYAAACEGSGPLEALVSRGVFPNQATTMGLTPLMIASTLGRIQNMIYLLKPRKSIPLPGAMKEVRFVDSAKGGMTPLHFAAENGHAEACKLLVDHGANMEAATSAASNKLTPIMLASRRGHFKAVKTLVEARASLDAKDKLKRTPLTHAVMNGNYVVASYLLRKGGDPNSRDTSGNTPLHYAAGYGWWHCIKLLLKAGAEPNAMNDWKVPPLYIAFLKGHSDCADVLIKEAGVGVDFRDSEGWTMVMMTVSRPISEETFKQLKYLVEEKKADVMLQDADGWNAMHHLASSQVSRYIHPKEQQVKDLKVAVECAKMLMEHGCDISAKAGSGETPVNIVMQQDPINTELVQLLLNAGATISLEAGTDGENVLHLLAKKVLQGDQSAIFDLLWKQSSTGAGNKLIDLMDVQDKNGFTPLLRLAQVYSGNAATHSPAEGLFANCTALMKRFVEKGKANIDYAIDEENKLASQADKDKGSAVFYFVQTIEGGNAATVTDRLNTLKTFLSWKPKINLRNKSGYTPLIQAIAYGASGEEAAKLLISSGANVKMNAELKADEKLDESPETPVILAAKKSLFSLVEILLRAGAPSSSPDSKCNVLHHLAGSKSSPVDVIKCLKICLNKGCDVNVPDAKKRTPLHYAVEALTADSTTDVVEYLLEHGADVFAKDEVGRLPLHYAFCQFASHESSSHMDPIEVVTMLTASMGNRGVDTTDTEGRTSLHFAAYRGATISVTHLVEHVGDLDAADNLGNTSLSCAVAGKHDSIAVLLIQRGANIAVPIAAVTEAYKKWEKEQEAIRKNKKVWVWEKKTPHVPDQVTSVTLLYKVVEWGWQGVLYLLMDKLERFGLPKTAVVQAVLKAKKWQLALSLVTKKMKNLRGDDLLNDERQNMLHVLALNSKKTGPTDQNQEHLKVAEALMSLGNDPLSLDSYRCSALTYAILARDYQLCSLFIDQAKKSKACFSRVDKQGRTALSAFFYHPLMDQDLWKFLCECQGGLSPNEVYLMPDWRNVMTGPPSALSDGYHVWKPPMVRQTPLLGAIKNRDYESVKFLLKNGAHVNKTDEAILTSPLMAAVQTNDFYIVQLLFDPEFDKDQRKGKNPAAQMRTIGGFGTSIVKKRKRARSWSRGSESSDGDMSDDYSEDEEEDDYDDDDGGDDENNDGTKDKGPLKNKTDLDLEKCDKDGRNVFHYLLLGSQTGTFENTKILDLLAKEAPVHLLESKDVNGQSPLDLAVAARAEKLVAAMEKLLKQKVQRLDSPASQWSDEIQWRTQNRFDYMADADSMLAEINALAAGPSDGPKPKAKVASQLGLTTGVEVVEDVNQGIPYSVLMTKVDVKYGEYGMNNFYKMQIVYQKGQDMYLLFTCWGRIGDDGQNQRTPFAKSEEAIKEFSKIFAAKSGNKWDNVKNFTHHPGKYRLMDVEPHASKKTVKAFNFDLSSELPSELPQPLQDLLKHLTCIPILDAVLKRSGVNSSLMPFGQLKGEVIQEAKQILTRIRKLLQDVKKDVDNSKLTDQSAAKMNEILDLSSQYYQLIPHADFAFDKIEPLNRAELLKVAENNIRNLVELELANRILLGAQYRIKEVNPLDYIYRALGCKVQLLDESSTEAQLILQQIEKTSCRNSVKVEGIYRLARDNEEEDLNRLKLDNHQLLWHGTKTANLISIMKRGLLTQPVESHGITGNLYGQGVYTSPVVGKSLNYCHNYYEPARTKFLLLCEVAVGKAQTDVSQEGFKSGFNSMLGLGSRCPNQDYNLRLKSGATIQMGEMTTRQGDDLWLTYDEFVVYTEEQVCLRYLVQFTE